MEGEGLWGGRWGGVGEGGVSSSIYGGVTCRFVDLDITVALIRIALGSPTCLDLPSLCPYTHTRTHTLGLARRGPLNRSSYESSQPKKIKSKEEEPEKEEEE